MIEDLAKWLHDQYCIDWAGDECDLSWDGHKPTVKARWLDDARAAKFILEKKRVSSGEVERKNKEGLALNR